MSEEKRTRFVRLAEARVNRTLRDIRLIGNLANTHNYDYTEEDVAKIFAALDSEQKALRARFAAQKGHAHAEFRLS